MLFEGKGRRFVTDCNPKLLASALVTAQLCLAYWHVHVVAGGTGKG